MGARFKECPLFLAAMALFCALAVWHVCLPDQSVSELEHARLTASPVFEWDALWSGSLTRTLDEYVTDQLPMRDTLVSGQAVVSAVLLRPERGGVLFGASNRLFDPVDQVNLRVASANLDALTQISAVYGVRVTLMLVPQSCFVYKSDVPALFPLDDVHAAMDALRHSAGAVVWADVLTPMQQAALKDPDLYYKTDHHWTASGARVGLEAYMETLDISCAPLTAETLTADGFLGSFYARSPSPLIPPDTLTFEYPPDAVLSVDGQVMPLLYDENALHERDKYAALLYGNQALLMLQGGTGQGTLLVLRDSFANALLPNLLCAYERIVAVDPRYFSENFSALVNETMPRDVLCLYGLDTFATDRHLMLLQTESLPEEDMPV